MATEILSDTTQTGNGEPKNPVALLRRKSKLIIYFIFMTFLVLSGCSQTGQNSAGVGEQVKAVHVLTIDENEYPAALNYIGTVDSEELIKYSFKMAGQIKRIYVTKGEHVVAGQILAELDSTDLDFQLATSRDTADIAEADVGKAQDALTYAINLYEKTQELFAADAVSNDTLDQAELNMNAAESDYQQAVSQHSAALTNYEYQSDLAANTVLYAEQAGYITEKTANAFERVGAYAPVLVVRSQAQVVNIGIPQQELSYVKIGSVVTVDVDGDTTSGLIKNISEYPDKDTRTYKAEVSFTNKTYPLGAIAKATVEIGNVTGIWIPLTAIFSSQGENCVYVINDDRALKRAVVIQKMRDDQVMVTGLAKGELLVSSGMAYLDDGAKVSITD